LTENLSMVMMTRWSNSRRKNLCKLIQSAKSASTVIKLWLNTLLLTL